VFILGQEVNGSAADGAFQLVALKVAGEFFAGLPEDQDEGERRAEKIGVDDPPAGGGGIFCAGGRRHASEDEQSDKQSVPKNTKEIFNGHVDSSCSRVAWAS